MFNCINTLQNEVETNQRPDENIDNHCNNHNKPNEVGIKYKYYSIRKRQLLRIEL